MPRKIKTPSAGSLDFCAAYRPDIYCKIPAFLTTARRADYGHFSCKLNKRKPLKDTSPAIRDFRRIIYQNQPSLHDEIKVDPLPEYFTIAHGAHPLSIKSRTTARSPARAAKAEKENDQEQFYNNETISQEAGRGRKFQELRGPIHNS